MENKPNRRPSLRTYMNPTSWKGRAFPPELWISLKNKLEWINSNLHVEHPKDIPTLEEILRGMGRTSACLTIIDNIQREIQHYSTSLLQEWPEELLLMKKCRQDLLAIYQQMLLTICHKSIKGD